MMKLGIPVIPPTTPPSIAGDAVWYAESGTAAAPVVAGFDVNGVAGSFASRPLTLNGVAGDLLIGFAFTNLNSPNVLVLPVGWTSLVPHTAHAANLNLKMIWGYRKLSAPEATSAFRYQTAGGVDDASTGWMCGGVRITGAGASPIDGHTFTNTLNQTTAVSPDLSTTGADRLILRAFGNGNTGPTTDSGYPSGTSGIFVRLATGAASVHWAGMASAEKAVAGAVGTATWAPFAATRQIFGMTIAISPDTPVLTLEPVSGAEQVAITVGSTERQTWEGYGWGVGSASDANTVAPLLNADSDDARARTKALFADLNCKILRLNNAETTNFASLHLPLIEHAIDQGVDRILCTGYVWQGDPSLTPTTTADAISAAITGGIPITHCNIQNEPDSPGNEPPTSYAVDVRADAIELRTRLNTLLRTSVKVIGCEWAHFGADGNTEWDLLNAAPSLIPGTVAHGAGHCYADCPATDIYDDRWATNSVGLWSCETGSAGSPNAQARALSGLNNGTIAEIFHQGHADAADVSGSDDDSQKLMRFDGTVQPWWGGMSVLFKNLTRGSIFRRCTSSDRPAGLAVEAADKMYRRNQGSLSSPSGNFYPRIQMAAAKRPDNSWIILGVNSTDGAGSTAPGHGAWYPAATLQMTTTIGELSTATKVLTTRRASKAGTITPGTANMVGGVVRFTLAPGETIALMG